MGDSNKAGMSLLQELMFIENLNFAKVMVEGIFGNA